MGTFQDILVLPSVRTSKDFFKKEQFVDWLDAPLDDPSSVPLALRKGIWDVWHGRVWRQLRDDRGHPFSEKFNVGLSLNVDWFCSYSRHNIKLVLFSCQFLPNMSLTADETEVDYFGRYYTRSI